MWCPVEPEARLTLQEEIGGDTARTAPTTPQWGLLRCQSWTPAWSVLKHFLGGVSTESCCYLAEDSKTGKKITWLCLPRWQPVSTLCRTGRQNGWIPEAYMQVLGKYLGMFSFIKTRCTWGGQCSRWWELKLGVFPGRRREGCLRGLAEVKFIFGQVGEFICIIQRGSTRIWL